MLQPVLSGPRQLVVARSPWKSHTPEIRYQRTDTATADGNSDERVDEVLGRRRAVGRAHHLGLHVQADVAAEQQRAAREREHAAAADVDRDATRRAPQVDPRRIAFVVEPEPVAPHLLGAAKTVAPVEVAVAERARLSQDDDAGVARFGTAIDDMPEALVRALLSQVQRRLT